MKTPVLVTLLCGLAFASALEAEAYDMDVRISGGYGLSLNSGTQASTNGGPSTYPLSPGVLASVEYRYLIGSEFQLGLGVFPEFMTRSFKTIGVNASFQLVEIQQTDAAIYYPIVFSGYLRHPLSERLSVHEGMGLGVVPATTVSSNFDQGFASNSYGLDAALAVRLELGADYRLGHGVAIGFGIQGLFYDQHVIQSSGWSALTQDFNQLAPVVAVDWGF